MVYTQNPSADLHIHSNYSDSTNTVEDLIRLAGKKKLRAISITDHDTVAAVDKARSLARNTGVEVIPGIEFSSRWNDTSVHLLGYFINHYDSQLIEYLKLCEERRVARAEAMIKNLRELGFEVSMDLLFSIANGGVLGRPHIAEAVMQVSEYTAMHEVFRDLLVRGKPAYVPKPTSDAAELIDLIHIIGGVSSLAHPKTVGDDSIIPRLAQVGLDAIEVVHSSHSLRDVEKYSALADQYKMVVSGGSDSHGGRLGREDLGRFTISMEQVDRLRNKIPEKKIKT
ncbi:MAG TPA: PHP domain-containing protein [bacterium]|nr:PHP domain-containing protein [bacterium]